MKLSHPEFRDWPPSPTREKLLVKLANLALTGDQIDLVNSTPLSTVPVKATTMYLTDS